MEDVGKLHGHLVYVFCGHLVYVLAIWYTLSSFSMLYREKSDNPASPCCP
jgi:hypothetical protein